MLEKLNVLWLNDNVDVAERMLFMYAINAKKNGWVKDITIIIWGPTAKLVAENKMIQDKIKLCKEVGIVVKACIACADSYGVSKDLMEQEIEVYGMGIPLTTILENDEKLLTI